jgi:hypothetical protein|tara:strand:- start:827 stop:1303 length:477 start_codon:yes stop_codon:yes gene_type:complete
MATQNIIQYLETSQYNALPSGGTVPVGIEAMNRRQIETFIASEAIAVGDALSLDLAQTNNGDKAIFVMKADTGTNAKRCGIGVAISAAAAAGDTLDVCIGGMAEAKVKAGTAVGDRLSIYSTVGILEPYQNTFEDPILAVAGAAEAGGKAIVFVIKQF